MLPVIDPIIVFIASNAIFIALGAVFSTISNEIFSFEKNDLAKYNASKDQELRNSIIFFISMAKSIYIINFVVIVILCLIKYILPFKEVKTFFDFYVVFFFIINLSWLVFSSIQLFQNYFKIRERHFTDKNIPEQ